MAEPRMTKREFTTTRVLDAPRGRTEMTTRFVGYQTDEIARASQVAYGTQIDKLAEHLAAKGEIT